MTMKKLFSTLLLTFIVSCLYGQPFTPSSNGEIVEHKYYTLSYIEEHEQPEWVYYHLTSEMVSGEAKRKNNFRVDPKVSTGSATLKHYTKSGYDRGHLCSAADMSFSSEAMSESFYMSNMSPQTPSFNRGKWKALEGQVRDWANEKGEIYVVTGPIFMDNKGKIGGAVTIPGYYYKVIYDPQSQKMYASIMPNEKIEKPISSFSTTVDKIEELTAIDFFSQLPDEIEFELESREVSMSSF